MYSTAFWYLFVVLLVFLALLRNHCYSFHRMKFVLWKEYQRLRNKAKKNSKTTNRHQNAVEYIAGKSFLFNSFKKK